MLWLYLIPGICVALWGIHRTCWTSEPELGCMFAPFALLLWPLLLPDVFRWLKKKGRR